MMSASRLAIVLLLAFSARATLGMQDRPTPAPDAKPSLDLIAEQAVLAEMDRQQAVGVAAGIIRSGKVVWIGCFGWQDREKRIAVTRRTMFRWASISKPLTAIAAAQLAEQARLDLDADVRTLVPEFPDKRVAISTRQLLGHLGGIVHYTNGEVIRTKRRYEVDHPHRDVILALDTFKESPLVAAPGSTFSYSTHGFILASAVVQRAGGAPFHEQVHARIGVPLGMHSLQPDYQWVPIADRATGYRRASGARRSGGVENIIRSSNTDVSWKLGGGGFISGIDDLAAFAAALCDDSFITPVMGAMLFTEQRDGSDEATGYGLGFRIARRDGDLVVSHSGAQEKTRAMLEMNTSTGDGIVLFTNSEHVDIRKFAQNVVRTITGRPGRR